MSLGFIHGNPPAVPGTVYENRGRCSPGVPVVLYLNNSPQGGSKTFYSDRIGGDGLDHALVMAGNEIYTVGFEEIYGVRTISGVPGDGDYNDVVLTVACTRDVTPIPEFPAIALPVGLIIVILTAYSISAAPGNPDFFYSAYLPLPLRQYHFTECIHMHKNL